MTDWTTPAAVSFPIFTQDIPSLIVVKAGENVVLPDINYRDGKSVYISIELASGRVCMRVYFLTIVTTTSCEQQNYSIVITLVDTEQLKTTYLVTIQVVKPEAQLQITPS